MVHVRECIQRRARSVLDIIAHQRGGPTAIATNNRLRRRFNIDEGQLIPLAIIYRHEISRTPFRNKESHLQSFFAHWQQLILQFFGQSYCVSLSTTFLRDAHGPTISSDSTTTVQSSQCFTINLELLQH